MAKKKARKDRTWTMWVAAWNDDGQLLPTTLRWNRDAVKMVLVERELSTATPIPVRITEILPPNRRPR